MKTVQGDRNDPETLIYLNNAKISDRPFYRIAVVVPMGSNPNIAQEIMRGVAQAQDELNQKDGINGKGLQVALINDDNESEVAKQVATALVNDPETLAVIGHNASNASLAAAPIYQNSGLVMITSTGFANGLSGFGSYIFRTSPDMRSTADVLADYVVKTTRKTRIAVCYDSQAPDNVSFKDEFVVALSALGGKLVPTVCDLSSPSFNPDAAMTEALNKGAEGLLLTPHIDRISYAIALARANRGRLPLYSSPSLYTMQTLEQGQIDMKGLVFPAPWHPQAGPAFATTARQYWGGMVNWRTATSYDAASAIITALQKGTTRTDLQQVLRNPSFQSPGASNTVRFLPTGDRATRPILVQVQSDGRGRDRFVPLNR
jgi:branched-chain amino acid transport system substrate-binding protein